jgi:hypothetical protein
MTQAELWEQQQGHEGCGNEEEEGMKPDWIRPKGSSIKGGTKRALVLLHSVDMPEFFLASPLISRL